MGCGSCHGDAGADRIKKAEQSFHQELLVPRGKLNNSRRFSDVFTYEWEALDVFFSGISLQEELSAWSNSLKVKAEHLRRSLEGWEVWEPGQHLPFSKAVTNRKLFPGPKQSFLIRSQAFQILAWVWSEQFLFCRVWLRTKQFCSKSFTLSQRKIIVPAWVFQQQEHLNGFHYILRTWWKVWGIITSTDPWIFVCQSSFSVEGGEGMI